MKSLTHSDQWELTSETLDGLRRTIRSIKKGIPRAKKQLVASRQRLSDLTKQPDWALPHCDPVEDTARETEQNRAISEAKMDVARDKKSLQDARDAIDSLKLWIDLLT